MKQDTYLYNRLLKRELQDISLIREMITRGLPEETYLQFLELKEKQLRKEYHTSCELDFNEKIPSDVEFEFTKPIDNV
jgi:CRISPR/Cas system-associated protein endoribonuclease Cas2